MQQAGYGLSPGHPAVGAFRGPPSHWAMSSADLAGGQDPETFAFDDSAYVIVEGLPKALIAHRFIKSKGANRGYMRHIKNRGVIRPKPCGYLKNPVNAILYISQFPILVVRVLQLYILHCPKLRVQGGISQSGWGFRPDYSGIYKFI